MGTTESNTTTPTRDEFRTVRKMVEAATREGKPAPVSVTFDSGRTVTREQAEIFAAIDDEATR